MELIWHGTASVELVCGQGRILFDPFVPLKHSSVGVKQDEFDGFTDIFVTHGHFDHIVDLPQIVRRNSDVMVYCTETPFKTLRGYGVPEKNLTRIDFGQTMELNGFRIRTFHGKHAVLPSASRARVAYALKSPSFWNLPHIVRHSRRCRENGETVFYQVEADGCTVALMGSLNLRDDVDYPEGADLLVLPYNGWEDNFPPAVQVIQRLKPKRVVLDHYDDSFPPLTMPLDLSPILNYDGLEIKALELHQPLVVK